MDSWKSGCAETSPLLRPLRGVAPFLAGGDWPGLATLQQALDEREVSTASGLRLRLVAPDGRAAYERRVFECGELECRLGNWHDLFNIVIWLAFPRAKAALNARHCAAWGEHGGTGRGRVRDALTLFDESGVLVLACDPTLLQLIRDFRWKDLFWQRRAEAASAMRFLPFGHALCEKALRPYRGMTGHALLLDVGAEVVALPVAEQLSAVDHVLASTIADPLVMRDTRDLAPLPVLGIPGSCADNECAEYYDDTRQFRPGRRLAVSDR